MSPGPVEEMTGLGARAQEVDSAGQAEGQPAASVAGPGIVGKGVGTPSLTSQVKTVTQERIQGEGPQGRGGERGRQSLQP